MRSLEVKLNIMKSTLCRLCLTSGENSKANLLNIFEYTVTNLVQKIESYITLQISKDDGLPTTACTSCIETIMHFDAFKEMCYKSYTYLCQKLSENIVNTDDLDISQKFNDYDKEEHENASDYIYFEDANNFTSLQKLRDTDNTEHGNKVNAEKDYEILDSGRKVKIYKIDDTIREIIGENLYTCDICKIQFDSFMEYFNHQDSHNGLPVFKCFKCDEVFSERLQLVEHDLKHKIPCEICKLEVLPKSMAAHLRIHTDIHKCPHCGMRHTSNASLEKHIKARHAGIKGFVCHICGKQSSCQSSMNRHMAYHSNERPYKCKFCDFCAKSLNIVQVHTSRRHFAEQCVCEICAKIFKSQPSLLQHMKRIHTTRKHVCDICGKAFIERYNLTRHLKKHAGQRLHECKICHKEFFTIRKLKEHMHSHRQGCVNCPKCGKEFYYKKYYMKHLVKCTQQNCANSTYHNVNESKCN